MIVIPAIDLKDGNCVRLEQGLMERDTVFSDSPGEQAGEWQRQGAELLHIVDLDGAFAGEPRNRAAIEQIVKAITIPTQLGGGVRDIATIEAYLSLGISRVILGTAAQRTPSLVEEACRLFPGRIVVGIDAKDGMVAVQGWAEVTGVTAADLARCFEGYGVAAIIYTDISRDGMMQGPNIAATRVLAESISTPVIASGGGIIAAGYREPAGGRVERGHGCHHRQSDLYRRHMPGGCGGIDQAFRCRSGQELRRC